MNGVLTRLAGRLRTGDLVARDAAGRIRIVDRVKDIVRSGGESIAPIEVELALLAHPAVVDAAVAGVPSERWGEELVAWLVVTEPVDAAAIAATCSRPTASSIWTSRPIPPTGSPASCSTWVSSTPTVPSACTKKSVP